MSTTIIFGLLALVLLVVGLAIPNNYNVIDPFEVGFVEILGRRMYDRGPGLTMTWPWENLKIKSVSQREFEIVVNLTTGYPDPMEFDLLLVLLLKIVDPFKSTYAFQGDLPATLKKLAQGAVQNALVKVGGNALLDNKMPQVILEAGHTLAETVDGWGLSVITQIADLEPPQVILDASAIKVRAEADAKAIRLLSEAEVEAYQREVAGQGNNYRFHQLLDTLQKMAQAGSFKAVGDLNSVIGLMVTEDGKLEKV